jgi:hypothetical protein
VGDLTEEATFNPVSLAGVKAKALATTGLIGKPNLQAVACPSATQCTAVGDQGDMMTFNPSTLAIVKNKNITHPSATGFYDLACVSTTVCVAGDTVGYMFEFNPTTGVLTTPKKLFDSSGAQFNGIACASGTQCTAVNQVGIEYTFNPAALPLTAHRATLTSNADPLQGIACPATNRCIAGDQTGNAQTFDPTNAKPKTTLQTNHVDPSNELFGMSCAAATFCATVDGDGNAYEGKPGTGAFNHDILPKSPRGVDSIGCSSNASATVCGAVDSSGDVYVGTGPGIKPPPKPAWIPLTLVNGWKNSLTTTTVASVESIPNGLVQLKGQIETAGTNPVAFTLPVGYRPATNVYVKVDSDNGNNGRLAIAPSGVVTVVGENGTFSNTAGWVSLDGVSFARDETSFTPVSLQNGWTSQPFGTANVAVENVGGVVHFAGAMSTAGTNPTAFTLPAADRPATNVFIPVDMYGASNGRLNIAPSGVVTVQAENSFNDAASFTSLEGASFIVNPTALTTLTLINGWTGGPFGTSQPAVANVAGVVRLKGAVANTSSPTVPFTLPTADRPAANVYIPVDMCDATNGRLDIAPSGVVTIEPEGGAFSNDKCFTSLDGAEFAQK